jgi:hypothetical protein
MTRVRLVTNEYRLGPVDQVELYIGDLHLRCDITSARIVELARRLAKELGVELQDLRKGWAV